MPLRIRIAQSSPWKVLSLICAFYALPISSSKADEPPLETAELPAVAETEQADPAVRGYTPWEVVRDSIIPSDSNSRTWSPLLPETFFTEGWNEPWIAPPNPSGGSRRQGWIGSNDAFFNRMIVGIESYTNGKPGQQDQHTGILLFETPVSRRYMVGVFAPLVDSLQNGDAPTKTAVADVTLENRFILLETQDTTFTFNLNVKVPTGVPTLGGSRTSLMPYLAMFKDIGSGFSLRGIAGVDAPVDSRPDGINSTIVTQLGIGQTLTPHDVPLFGDFTYYVMLNYREFLGPNTAFVSITPGFRTHLGHNFWFLGGVGVPVTGPRPYQDQLTFVLVKGY